MACPDRDIKVHVPDLQESTAKREALNTFPGAV